MSSLAAPEKGSIEPRGLRCLLRVAPARLLSAALPTRLLSHSAPLRSGPRRRDSSFCCTPSPFLWPACFAPRYYKCKYFV